VYRVDYLTKVEIPVGTVTERRNQSRGAASYFGLMKLARKMFAQSPEDQLRITSGKSIPPEPHQIATRTGIVDRIRATSPDSSPTRNPRRPP